MSSPDAPKPTDTASDEPPSRISRYDEIYDMRKRTTVYRRTNRSDSTKQEKRLKKNNPILVVRRVFNTRGQHTSTSVDIKSQKLAQFLQDLYKGIDGLDIHRHPPWCNSKLLALSGRHIRDRLDAELASVNADKEFLEALEISSLYVEEDFGPTFKRRNALLHDGSEPLISFDLLWTLFRPGCMLYMYDDSTDQSMIIQAQTFEIESNAQEGLFAVVGSHILLHDGKMFGKAVVSTKIPQFTGTRKLRDLPVYPLDLYPLEEVLRRQASARGRKFVGMMQQSCTFHEIVEGPAMYEGARSGRLGGACESSRFGVQGRVMIDPQSYRAKRGNSAHINPPVNLRLDPNSLNEEEYMLCTPIVTGFSFTTKRWGGFALDRLIDVNWSNKPFDQLVFDTQTKALIHAMVKQHRERVSNFDDLVKGKGRGLVGLLCGPPGCGKTLTAEAVAEATQSPLYTLSAGELGTHSSSVEENLKQVLELAERWRAVVLLDEADVFLAQRDSRSLERNALVSVFLRKLEYYQGILILTTNLINQCDAAFESRIHFTIHYPALPFHSRRQIWETFVSQACCGKGKLTANDINHLSTFSLNGRQIKNSVAVAQSFASGEGVPLSRNHIDMVLRVSRQWEHVKEGGQDLVSSRRGHFLQGLALGAGLCTVALVGLRRVGYW